MRTGEFQRPPQYVGHRAVEPQHDRGEVGADDDRNVQQGQWKVATEEGNDEVGSRDRAPVAGTAVGRKVRTMGDRK